MKVTSIEKTADYYIRQGYDIIEPPLEFKGRFEMDIQAALMNIAGISISHVTKFITYDNLVRCYNKSKNPFRSNVISIGMKDNLSIKDFFIPELVPPEIYTMPLFIHEDTSLTGDRTGIGCVAAMGYRYQNEYDIESGETVPTKVLVYKHVFSLGIQCPNGDEISFQKSRDFIYYLKHELGWNIRGISSDSFQSADNKQQLITMGFKDSTIISLDRKPDGYLVLKYAINEHRISMLNIPELEVELIRLERDNMSGKIDHPPDGCFSYDTKIILVDSKGMRYDICIGEIANNYDLYKDYKVLGVDDSGNTILTNYTNPRATKKVDKLLEIELDNGSTIRCTHNHPFLCLVNGNYKYIEAQYLSEEHEIVEPFKDIKSSVSYLRNIGISYSKICVILKEKILDLYLNKEMTLRDISEIYNISKTSLNGFLSNEDIKRGKSDANLLAKRQGKNRGAITLVKTNKLYRDRVRITARQNITKYNKSDKARQERINRIVSEDTRMKLRSLALKRWKDPDYINKMLKVNNGNGYGNHQYYYSDIFNIELYLKSNVEKLFVELCEAVCSSLEYETIRIQYYDNEGNLRTYIPDFCITYNSKKYLIEVKDRDNHNTGINKLKYDAGMRYASDNNLTYLWLKREDIIKLLQEVSSNED